MVKAVKNPLQNLRAYRESLGENQTQFWSRFLVTQSGGSRYESGRGLPAPIAMLVIAYAEGLIDDKLLGKLAARVIKR